ISRWVSWHGIAINVSAAMLDGFQHIIPCGINGAGVAALEQCTDQPPDHLMARLDQVLMAEFANTLGRYMDSDIAKSAP
ncbi:MAG TPA: hypothetical protein DIT62_02710, partial [Alphaproteobacteria bacterium]|nr:hypothetical protein [Alphaproteobacteria bacterium]